MSVTKFPIAHKRKFKHCLFKQSVKITWVKGRLFFLATEGLNILEYLISWFKKFELFMSSWIFLSYKVVGYFTKYKKKTYRGYHRVNLSISLMLYILESQIRMLSMYWQSLISEELSMCNLTNAFFSPCETIKICQIVRNWLFNDSLMNHFTTNILMKFIFNTLVFRYARKQSFFVLWKSSNLSHELHWEHMWRIDCNLFFILINFLLFWFKISSKELNVFQVNEIALSGGVIIYTGKRVSCMI